MFRSTASAAAGTERHASPRRLATAVLPRASAATQPPTATPVASPPLGIAQLPPMSPPTAAAAPTARSAPALSLGTAARRQDFAEARPTTAVPDASPHLASARLRPISQPTVDAAPESIKRSARGPPLATVARRVATAGVQNIAKQAARRRLASATAAAAPSRPTDSAVSRMERRARARALGIAAPPAGTAAPQQHTVEPGARQPLEPARPGPETSRWTDNAAATARRARVLPLETVVPRADSAGHRRPTAAPAARVVSAHVPLLVLAAFPPMACVEATERRARDPHLAIAAPSTASVAAPQTTAVPGARVASGRAAKVAVVPSRRMGSAATMARLARALGLEIAARPAACVAHRLHIAELVARAISGLATAGVAPSRPTACAEQRTPRPVLGRRLEPVALVAVAAETLQTTAARDGKSINQAQ